MKALRAEVERLRAEVEQGKGTAPIGDRAGPDPAPAATGGGPSLPAVTPANFTAPAVGTVSGQPAVVVAPQGDSGAVKPAKAEPFAFADWTWLNGNPRTKEVPLDSKFFTPEIRGDVDYNYDFNHPKDDYDWRFKRGISLERSWHHAAWRGRGFSL